MTYQKNPSEPTGAATERVVTYYRTPAHKKGREWLERELGQMRLFNYNPAHLTVEKIGQKYAVLLNSQILKRDLSKVEATNYKKSLTERAAKIRRNPDDGGELAATAAGEAIEIFDANDDGAIDLHDVEMFEGFDESNLVIDEVNHLSGEILTETIDGDVVIKWSDGQTTVEDCDDLAQENGFKSWQLRRKAAKHYKRGLRHEELARKARDRQSDHEAELKQNPFGLAEFANLAVGTHSALAIHKMMRGGKKRNVAKTIETPRKNPATIAQRVAAAKKSGAAKMIFAAKYLDKVKAYVEKSGGAIRKSQNKYYLHFAKTNPSTAKTRTTAKTNPAAVKPKRNSAAYEAFQGRPSTKEMLLLTPRNAPKNLYVLGLLLELKIAGQSQILDLRKEATGKNFWLCADQHNNQLWIAGGRIAEKDSQLADDEADELGLIHHVVYMTRKDHLGDTEETPYIHKLGEEGGQKPMLAVDNEGYPHILGGDYEITPLGIKD